MTINVVLADDHPLIRAGIRSALAGDPEIALIGEAADGDEAQKLCQEYSVDILFLDIQMPGPSTADTIRFLRENHPEIQIIILTAYDDEAYVKTYSALGVRGYLLKDEATEAVVRAIHAVRMGDFWYSSRVMHILGNQNNQLEAICKIDNRQVEILILLKQGLKTGQIAKKLDLSERTVRYHIENILDILDAKNRVEAVSKAVTARII